IHDCRLTTFWTSAQRLPGSLQENREGLLSQPLAHDRLIGRDMPVEIEVEARHLERQGKDPAVIHPRQLHRRSDGEIDGVDHVKGRLVMLQADADLTRKTESLERDIDD